MRLRLLTAAFLVTVWMAAVEPVCAVEIAPGVTYTEYSFTDAAGFQRVFVVAVDRARSEYKLEVGWNGKHRRYGTRATVRSIAGQYDDPAHNHDVIAATNGSFWGDYPTIVGYPIASNGDIVAPPATQNDTFYFGPSRSPGIESLIQHQAGTLTFANGTTLPLDDYNTEQTLHAVVAYTPGFNVTTDSTAMAVEVILNDVTYPMRSGKEVSGIVTAVRTGSASLNNVIPPGGMVLNAYGSPASIVYGNARVGDRLKMRFNTSSQGMNNADMAITGIGWIIHNGLKQDGTNGQPNNWAERPNGSPYNVDPMTVLAFNNTHLFMVVCEGRSCNGTAGMTFSSMADFLTGTLGALDAINMDGGGSSTMVVNGVVKNTPADGCGTERAVANAIMLVRQTPPPSFPFSDRFVSSGRLAGWDDKFSYAGVAGFSPPSPGGGGYVLKLGDSASTVETVRRGDFGDQDYSVQAHIYCEYRPNVAADGLERYALFARDSGTGALGLSGYGGGNCYAMVYDTDTGRLWAGKYVNGTLSDFLPDPMYITTSGWQKFRIDCNGNAIQYRLNDAVIAEAIDGSHARGFFGLGYQNLFATGSNVHGTRADNLVAFVGEPPVPGDFDGDRDVDQDDFGTMQLCMSGPNVEQSAASCLGARFDDDGDVDVVDAARFIECMSGPGSSGDPACNEW